MHSPLEAYLDQVAVHLSALPAKRRTEELREMRQHLQNAVTVNQELGQSEEDAAANAVMQFGTPKDLGNNLVWAWKRGEKKLNKRSFWVAAACTPIILFVLGILGEPFAYRWWMLSSIFVTGAICGNLLSRRGVAGIVFGLALYDYVFGGSVFVYAIHQPGMMHLAEPLSRTAGLFFIQQTEQGLLTLFIAWATSRWRITRRTEQV